MSEYRELKYGMNPHQQPARLLTTRGTFPFEIVNGDPGYINMMDALHAWQLVRELKQALNRPAAASFKHVSPAGASVAAPLTDEDKRAFLLPDDLELTPLATALIRARGADPVSSFGDFIALSDVVDEATASLLVHEVSDGVIAPGYDPKARRLLAAKRRGSYLMIQIDPDYVPPETERREIFGITFEQKRNDALIRKDRLGRIVTKNETLSDDHADDAVIALSALKFTQSNSVAFAWQGQAIGIGAGQQSRIHCTRIAAEKAETWMLRRHPKFASAQFAPDLSRTAKYNAVDMCLRYRELTPPEKEALATDFIGPVPLLSSDEKKEWISRFQNIVYASDAFIPFRDNIDRAARAGARIVVQPGGSARDEDVIQAANDYGMTMLFTQMRLFTH